jgi:trk system potassium uptake protein TrkA
MFEGHDPGELSARIRGSARLFSFVVREADARPLRELDLPAQTRVVCFYRDDEFQVPADDTRLAAGDEVVLITHSGKLEELSARWGKPGGKRA